MMQQAAMSMSVRAPMVRTRQTLGASRKAISNGRARSLRVVAAAGKIVVFGGSGATGSETIYQALEQGYDVQIEANLEIAIHRIRCIKIGVITKDTTGVVISLGGKSKDVGETMLTDGSSNVIAAMKTNGVKRVAVVTSIGAGDSAGQAPLVFKGVCSFYGVYPRQYSLGTTFLQTADC
eukprot:288571-Prorocentrum_minimum.AAC.1